LQLVAELLLARLVHRELLAALAGVGAALIARIGGFELAIGGEQLACKQAKVPEQVDHDDHGLVDHVVPDTVAEVTQVTLAWNVVMQTGQLPVAMPLVGLVQIAAEVGIVDVLIYFGGHLQHDEASRIVAGAAAAIIGRRTERAGEAEVQGGADEPTEAAFDVALGRQLNGTRGELIVRKPPAGRLGKWRREGLAVVLVEGVGMGHKRVEVTGRELLRDKGQNVSAHSSSSS
jgi:hypothetical protein